MRTKTLIFFITLFSSSLITSYAQSWSVLNGPTGTWIKASLLVNNSNEMYCLTNSGKVFYSNNKGLDWVEFSTGLIKDIYTSYSGKFKETNQGTVYLALEERLYKLNAQQKNWELLFYGDQIKDFDVSPDGTKVYLATTRHFYISTNAQQFVPIQNWEIYNADLICLGSNNNLIRISTGIFGEIWKFNDDASNRRKIRDAECCDKLFYHQRSGKLFDLSATEKVSLDFGETWNNISWPSGLYFVSMVELSGGSTIGFSNRGLLRSFDEGISWTPEVDYQLNLQKNYLTDIHEIHCSNMDEICIRIGGQVYFLNPSSFREIRLPLVEPSVKSIHQLGSKTIFCQTYHGDQLSLDDGQSWTEIPISVIGDEPFVWSNSTFGYIFQDTLYIKDQQFTLIGKKLLPTSVIEQKLQDSYGNMILIAHNQIYFSSDQGSTWTIMPSNSSQPFPLQNIVKISRQNILYTVKDLDSIYYSINAGVDWNSFQAPGLESGWDWLNLSIDNVFSWLALNAQSELVFRYTLDFGGTFQDIPFNLSSIYIDDLNQNYYINTRGNGQIEITDLFTGQLTLVDANELELDNSAPFLITRGMNDHLYFYKPNKPLYKSSQRIITQRGLLKGRILIDGNQNCIQDALEVEGKEVQLELKGVHNKLELNTQKDGSFIAFVAQDTYDIGLKTRSLIWESCNFPNNIAIKPIDTFIIGDLLVRPNELCADLFSSVLFNRLRRCFSNNQAVLSIQNEGSVPAINVKLTMVMDDYFENIQSSITPDDMQGRLWTFTIPEIKPGRNFNIYFTFGISCTATLGQTHCLKYLIENARSCNGFLPSIDTISVCDVNVGAFDPNDKTAYVSGVPAAQFHDEDTLLTYVIRFQNTGTDTAFNIRIEDPLDYQLDRTSIQVISSSHPYNYIVNDYGLMSVQFNDVFLPDSNIDEQGSHGYFMYSIKPKKGLKWGTLIHNTASIFFDYNDPVMTNIARLKLEKTTRVENIVKEGAMVFIAVPTPSDRHVEVLLPEQWKAGRFQVTLISSEGKVMRSWKHEGGPLYIEKGELNAGSYWLSLMTNKGQLGYSHVIFK